MNYPFIYIFWSGFAVSMLISFLTKHTCDALRLVTDDDDKDSPEWD